LNLKKSLLTLSGNQFHIAGLATEKNPPTISAETMARHDEKTSAGRAKMLSGGDTGDRLAEVDEVLGCKVVQTVNTMRPSLNATRSGR